MVLVASVTFQFERSMGAYSVEELDVVYRHPPAYRDQEDFIDTGEHLYLRRPKGVEAGFFRNAVPRICCRRRGPCVEECYSWYSG